LSASLEINLFIIYNVLVIKKYAALVLITVITVTVAVLFSGCSSYDKFTLNGWEKIALERMGKSPNEVDLTKLKVEDFIDLSGLTTDTYLYADGAKKDNSEGWYATLIDNFDVVYTENSGLNPQIWATSRHDVRWASQKKSHPEYANYWCSEMVSVVDGVVKVKAEYDSDHQCDICKSVSPR